MKTITLTILAITAALLFVSAACVVSPQPAPTPMPVPITDEVLYKLLRSEADANPSRLREREHNEEIKFQGPIDWIDERKIRFYVESSKSSVNDKYIECNFDSDSDLAPANKGDHVTVEGELVRAFRGRLFGFGETEAVVFEDCRILLVHR